MRRTISTAILQFFVFYCCAVQPVILGLQDKEFIVRGRIICLDGSGQVETCTDGSTRYAIRNDTDTFYFLPEDHKARIFQDSRVREREIEVTGWLRDANQLEIIRVYSVKQGKRFEIQYFCSVCNIKAFVGGVCWCCQDEFEFREVPVEN
jgi:hypothetical protein